MCIYIDIYMYNVYIYNVYTLIYTPVCTFVQVILRDIAASSVCIVVAYVSMHSENMTSWRLAESLAEVSACSQSYLLNKRQANKQTES